VAVGLLVALAVGVPGTVHRQYDRFVAGDRVRGAEGDVRSRLTNPGNNGRIDQWRVALDAFSAAPVRGQGAGTYALEWDRRRTEIYQVEDAHSLYVEALGELGLVGLLLVVAAVVVVLGGFLARARGPDRVVGGALFGAGVAWALHAGVDWDWEMPAVTFWLFAAGGLALAAPAGAPATAAGPDGGASPASGPATAAGPDGGAPPAARGLPPLGRTVLALGGLLLALVPARVFLSEGPLRDSARAFAAGDCPRTIDRALDSAAAFGVRPEPFILLGYCDVRIGRPDLAVRALDKAVRRDPRNWEGHYGLALARAAAGRDPRPALRAAGRLNPLEPLVARTTRLLDTPDPRAWRRRAPLARLPSE
jgi:hypothetical protein